MFDSLSAVQYHVDIISKRYFLVCHLRIVFYFLHELKQRSTLSLDGINGRSTSLQSMAELDEILCVQS